MASANGFTCKVHHLEAKVGGTLQNFVHHFTTGAVIPLAGIPRAHAAPNASLHDKFDDPNLPGEMQTDD